MHWLRRQIFEQERAKARQLAARNLNKSNSEEIEAWQIRELDFIDVIHQLLQKHGATEDMWAVPIRWQSTANGILANLTRGEEEALSLCGDVTCWDRVKREWRFFTDDFRGK